jgi:hypothetical protein
VTYPIEAPKFECGTFVITDQGKSLVMGREWCEWPAHRTGKKFWIYWCAPVTEKEGKTLTNRATCRYTAEMLREFI